MPAAHYFNSLEVPPVTPRRTGICLWFGGALLATPSADRPKAVLNFVSLHAFLVNEDIHKRPFDSMFTDARVG
jgi:hypothetical protein